jgi:DNA polymerase III delta subunit
LIKNIKNLGFNTDYYYIKRGYVVERIQFENRTFYAKFEKINEPINDTLLKQHLKKESTVAFPFLDKNNLTTLLLIEYKGDEAKKFYYTAKQLFNSIGIEKYEVYEGKSDKHIQIYIKTEPLSLEDADTKLQNISNLLCIKLPNDWRTLPNKNLPKPYNIATLPYKKY